MSTNDNADNGLEEMRVDRRTAIKWVVAAGAALQLPPAVFDANAAAAGTAYGKDPNLLKIYQPGTLWALTLTAEQRKLAATLCDLIIPADEHSPAASSVGVVDFIDEWISAPYPDNARDKPIVLEGFAWLDAEAKRRFSKSFVAASEAQRTAICDDIAAKDVKPQFSQAAAFFSRYRSLTAGGFYTTPVGRKDLKYVGNEPLTEFPGPPEAVLKQLGLT
jgi:hypothetical protein